MCHLHFFKKNEYIKALCQQKLHLLHNIFKIGQKSLSKLFMTSQQTYTCLKSARETMEVNVVLMSLFLPLNIIHTIFESLLLTLNRKIFIQIASSDYETISIDIDFLDFLIDFSCLGGYLTHLDVADMSDLFYYHFVFT